MVKTKIKNIIKGFKTPEARWARFGPYYAMFPVDFAFDVINKYSKRGDHILDPFAGRSTSIYAGGALGRHGLGIEINPVGWLYGKVKLNPAPKQDVVDRLYEIYDKRNYYNRAIKKLPEFYRICYCDDVLKFLLFARKNLDWKNDDVDSTLMSIILVFLHAKLGEGLSNQMRMTKSMGMNYSVEWWKANNMSSPPDVNPLKLMLKKINWRYEKGMPKIADSSVLYGDSTIELENINAEKKFSLLFTSPPYYSITDYHADQWLRLWMLGEEDKPKISSVKHKGRFFNKKNYYDLLDNVFGSSSKLMKQDSVIYIRTDKREFTLNTTREILKKHFPHHKERILYKPITKSTKTQTKLFGDKSLKPGEVDIILKR
ncbi:DNA methyltransferase [Microscilla marina]|uniref:site-specific DNA-methyltransferase (cytosine-N(4)-specific) n=1 Tax=Microscilla marina ATCC 23134 TaxID=313606 RepID=A1ZJW1_MICM2|nr:DNA methyltransferase [Microscilla marina]EAY29414.1 DNA methylase, putative [Microscilla marina ATCC 23134]